MTCLKECLSSYELHYRLEMKYLYFKYKFVHSTEIAVLEECRHPTVMKDMCAECGTDLRTDENAKLDVAIVPMVHSVPELKVTYVLFTKQHNSIGIPYKYTLCFQSLVCLQKCSKTKYIETKLLCMLHL